MARTSPARLIILAPLALLGACLQMAPRSSVPFHASVDREIRYAAEVTLAVKENRRDEVSEAAANGRVVLPQMPEIWASPKAYDARKRAGDADQLALLDAAGPTAGAGPEVDPAAVGCAGVWWERRDPDDCPDGAPGAGPALAPLLPAAITPPAAAGPRAWPIR
jgi:hypothetical protein